MRSERRRAVAAAAGLVATALLRPVRGASARVAVLYPAIGEPFRSVFARIVDGIEDRLGAPVVRYPLGAASDGSALSAALRRDDTRQVIALGRSGLKAAAALEGELRVVAGGVVAVLEPEARAFTVHSLAPDPMLLFQRLKALVPHVRRVLVIYSPQQNAWLLRAAGAAATALGLELASHAASDIGSAMLLYQELLARAEPRADALWLPQDGATVQDGVVLPVVLRIAWTRQLAVFSSNVEHVRQGVLFALYPDNFEVGRRLASLMLAGGHDKGVTPSREVLAAINTSTAQHLELELSHRQLQTFELIFPER